MTCSFLVYTKFWIVPFFKKKSSPEIINFTTISSNILQTVLITVLVLLSIFIIPIDFFTISAILIIASILISILFFQKILTINDKGMRYGINWTLKWEDIDSCNIEEEKNTLSVHMKNGENKKISGINNKYCKVIESVISNHFKK